MEFVTQSRALANLPNIERFLGAKIRYRAWLSCEDNQTFVTWGRKIEVESIENKARQWSIPLYRLEDGFIAYLRHPEIMKQPFSIIIDRSGIYYDSTQSSDLEDILNQMPQSFGAAQLERSKNIIATLRRLRVSKYNHQNQMHLPDDEDCERVLLVDQSYMDRSVHFSGATTDTFHQMVEDAIANHPKAKIYAKLHPDYYLAAKGSYLSGNLPSQIKILPAGLNSWSVLEHMDQVYTVSSQLGFEALMLEKNVHCYAKPFYAGWGLTQDRCKLDRRTARLSLEQLVYGALLRYPQYIHPANREKCELEDVLCYLETYLKPHFHYQDTIFAIGMSPWKKSFLRRYLMPHYCRNIRFISQGKLNSTHYRSGNAVLVWGYQNDDEVQRLKSMGYKILRVEDGFIRSVGLGTDLRNPLSLAVCQDELHFVGNYSSSLVQLLNHYKFSDAMLNRAASLRASILRHAITKYNLDCQGDKLEKTLKDVCLVIGQVPQDASILLGSENCRSDIDLLNMVRRKFPDALIYYRPHPDTIAGNRPAWKVDKSLYDKVLADNSLQDCLAVADSVHVMTSTCGLEALLHGKTVYTYGRPFYGGWGLTIDQEIFPHRRRKCSMDELLAAAFILYPIYMLPNKSAPQSPEAIIQRIVHERTLRRPMKLEGHIFQRVLRRTKYLMANSWERT